MTDNKTQYVTFSGTAKWAKVYVPDEFRGAERWTVDLYMDDPAEWEKFKKLGIQKKIKTNEEGTYFNITRPTNKLIKGKIVYFTPPIVLDKDGTEIVKYVDDKGRIVIS